MSDPKSTPSRANTVQPALKAAMTDAATDPVRRALWLDSLEQLLRPYLPPALSPHCRLGNVAGKRLVFIVDSPVWHTRLRLAAQDLVNAARSIGLDVTEVTVKTTTVPFRPATPAQTAIKVKPMSEVARSALQAALASLDDSDSTKLVTASNHPRKPKK